MTLLGKVLGARPAAPKGFDPSTAKNQAFVTPGKAGGQPIVSYTANDDVLQKGGPIPAGCALPPPPRSIAKIQNADGKVLMQIYTDQWHAAMTAKKNMVFRIQDIRPFMPAGTPQALIDELNTPFDMVMKRYATMAVEAWKIRQLVTKGWGAGASTTHLGFCNFNMSGPSAAQSDACGFDKNIKPNLANWEIDFGHTVKLPPEKDFVDQWHGISIANSKIVPGLFEGKHRLWTIKSPPFDTDTDDYAWYLYARYVPSPGIEDVSLEINDHRTASKQYPAGSCAPTEKQCWDTRVKKLVPNPLYGVSPDPGVLVAPGALSPQFIADAKKFALEHGQRFSPYIEITLKRIDKGLDWGDVAEAAEDVASAIVNGLETIIEYACDLITDGDLQTVRNYASAAPEPHVQAALAAWQGAATACGILFPEHPTSDAVPCVDVPPEQQTDQPLTWWQQNGWKVMAAGAAAAVAGVGGVVVYKRRRG